jgi:hypothetical protein
MMTNQVFYTGIFEALANDFSVADLKRYLLLFDRIAIPQLDSFPQLIDNEEMKELVDRKLVQSAREFLIDADPNPFQLRELQLLEEKWDKVLRENRIKANKLLSDQLLIEQNIFEFAKLTFLNLGETLKKNADLLNFFPCYNAVPILRPNTNVPYESYTKNSRIAHFIVQEFPIIKEEQSIEKILGFKESSLIKGFFLRLRAWIRRLERSDFDPKEFYDEYQEMMHNYSAELARHKMDTVLGTIEIILTNTLEIAENIARFRFSKLPPIMINGLSFQNKLKEVDSNIPKNEIAYIYHAKKKFRQ